MSTWAVYEPRSATQEHLWSSCISPARCSCISTAIKPKAKVLLDDTACRPGRYINHESCISTAIKNLKRKHFWLTQPCRPGRCINRDSKAKHLWRKCISPARYSCISTAIKNSSESTSGRHSRVDLGGVSTAISKAKASLARLYITSAV